MPDWVLLMTDDSLSAAGWEQEIRLAGYSPLRAPDAERAAVLLKRGGPPAAVVVDLSSSGEAGLAAARALIDSPAASARSGSAVAIVSGEESRLTVRAEEAGMIPISRDHAGEGGLARSIASARAPNRRRREASLAGQPVAS